MLFCQHDLAGLVILAATFVRPEVGALGLLAAVSARLMAQHLGYTDAEQPPEIYNALLIGLGMAFVWKVTPLTIGVVILTGAITALVTHVLSGWLWRLNRLPVMSLTFVLILWAFLLVARITLVDGAAGAEPVVAVTRTAAAKCDRCWTFRDDVGHDATQPGLCTRCTTALAARR